MRCLLLVDIQNDSVPGGALAVPQGDEVIGVANRRMPTFELIIATRDWHPADHVSFSGQHPGRKAGDVIDAGGLEQVLWPKHCVQGTWGAELAAGLDQSRIRHIISKGTDRSVDSYSGFFDNGRRQATSLERCLREERVTSLHIMGLATDYCVKATALDARELGWETYVIKEGCRGVDLTPGDSQRAFEEMLRAGVSLI
jgi:nicotinamidase/pyrazinamidase